MEVVRPQVVKRDIEMEVRKLEDIRQIREVRDARSPSLLSPPCAPPPLLRASRFALGVAPRTCHHPDDVRHRRA